MLQERGRLRASVAFLSGDLALLIARPWIMSCGVLVQMKTLTFQITYTRELDPFSCDTTVGL